MMAPMEESSTLLQGQSSSNGFLLGFHVNYIVFGDTMVPNTE